MLYIRNMKRLIKIIIPLFFTSLLFTSCEDLFNETNTLLDEIKDNINSEIPDPKRIFVGGSFTYNWDGRERSGLVALNGSGDIDPWFDNSNSGLIYDSMNSTGMRPGVNQLMIIGSELYVSGNFQGYDIDGSYIAYDPLTNSQQEYKYLQRYHLNNGFDATYKPFSGLSIVNILNPEFYALQPLPDGTTVVAGYFDPHLGSSGSIIRLNYDGLNSTGIAAPPVGTYLYALDSVFDEQLLFAGGAFSNFGVNAGFNNFTAVEISSGAVADSTGFSDYADFPTSTEIWAFAEFENSVFIAGKDNSDYGFIQKYNFDGNQFISDDSFNNNFYQMINDYFTDDPIAPTIWSFNNVYTLQVDKTGKLYIGGGFYSYYDVNGFYINNLMRLNPDGTLDTSFKISPSSEVNDIVIQKNGKILICGSFYDVETTNGMESGYKGLLRITEYGTIDYSFNHGSMPSSGGTIYAIAVEEEPE